MLAVSLVAVGGALVVALVMDNGYAWHMSKAFFVRRQRDHAFYGGNSALAATNASV